MLQEIDDARVERERRLPWLDIETAPLDGTRVYIHRIGRKRPYPKWAYAEIAHYEVKPDGLKGWFSDKGEYHSPWPDSWLPLGTPLDKLANGTDQVQ